MDEMSLVTAPDKASGHISSAFNALSPMMTDEKLVHYIPLPLLCATVAAPFDYKRRPAVYRERILIFWTTHASLAWARVEARRSGDGRDGPRSRPR